MAKTKGTKNYPQGVKEKIIKEYNSGLSQCELSRKTKLTPLEKRSQYIA